jgi:dienelactone hydrolase
MRKVLLFISLFYSLPAASELVLQSRGQMPDQMISESWKSAKIYIPGLSGLPIKFNEVPEDTKKYPVVIFLHGCGGINKDSLRWGRFLSKLGYITVLPDSFAIPGRKKNCDSVKKIRSINKTPTQIKNLRANEARVAKNKILKMSWADRNNLFLMGHSEGGSGVVFMRGLSFKAVVSSGFKCGKYHPTHGRLPIRLSAKVPVLFIYYKNDPWFDQDNCKDFVKTRNNVKVIELEGDKHGTSSNQIARDAVAEFFSKNKN